LVRRNDDGYRDSGTDIINVQHDAREGIEISAIEIHALIDAAEDSIGGAEHGYCCGGVLTIG